MFVLLLHGSRLALDALIEVLCLANPLMPLGPTHTPVCGWERGVGRVQISIEQGTDGRSGEISRDRGEKENIGERKREATGFQSICDLSMHTVAIGDQSLFKPAEASKNSKHSCLKGDAFPCMTIHSHTLSHTITFSHSIFYGAEKHCCKKSEKAVGRQVESY